MKLVACDTCGQSINPKRDVCPFCGAAVQKKSSPFTMPTRAAQAQAPPSATDAAKGASETTDSVPARPWWKRPNIIIPIAVGAVVLVAACAVLAMNVRANNARKAEATAALLPFHRLQSAVTWGKVSISLNDYQTYVRDAQYAYDSYKPSDARGKEFARNLKEAALGYNAALAGWQLQEASWELLPYDADREGKMEEALGGIWKESDRLVKQAEKAFD